MQSDVLVFKDAEDLARHAADRIVQIAQEAVQERGRFVVALAGGSTPEKTYAILARPDRSLQIDWSRTFLFFGDERFVSGENPLSNLAMVRGSLLDPASVPAAQVFPVPTVFSTAEEAASEYETILVEFFAARNRTQLPRFDLILLGLGEDGHTASLFPHADALKVSDRWVVATPPGVLPPPVDRVTFTFPVLNMAREVMFLVSGLNKSKVLQEVLEAHPPFDDCPAVDVHPEHGNVAWFVDEDAASKFKR